MGVPLDAAEQPSETFAHEYAADHDCLRARGRVEVEGMDEGTRVPVTDGK